MKSGTLEQHCAPFVKRISSITVYQASFFCRIRIDTKAIPVVTHNIFKFDANLMPINCVRWISCSFLQLGFKSRHVFFYHPAFSPYTIHTLFFDCVVSLFWSACSWDVVSALSFTGLSLLMNNFDCNWMSIYLIMPQHWFELLPSQQISRKTAFYAL